MMTSSTVYPVGRPKTQLSKRFRRSAWLYVLGLPGILILILFNYLPMQGLLMAFQNIKLS
jgi:putative aldouronate transport system permease protein